MSFILATKRDSLEPYSLRSFFQHHSFLCPRVGFVPYETESYLRSVCLCRMRTPMIENFCYPDKKENHGFAYLVIFLFTCLALSPVINSKGWFPNHENFRYFYLIHFFKEAFVNGFFYPRWIPDLYGGYGYPLFVFYQPTFFFFSLPFSIIGFPPFIGMLLLLIAIIFSGGIGVYKIGSLLTRDRSASIIFAIIFLFTPYIFQDLYIRGALSELSALLLSPWPLYCLMKLNLQIQKNADYTFTLLQFLFALVLFIPSHPATTMFYIPTLMLFVIVIGLQLRTNSLKFIYLSYLTLFIGFIVTAPYWLIVKLMMPMVNLNEAISGYFTASTHVVYPQQLFSIAWHTAGISVAGPEDKMAFSLGLLHVGCSVAGFLLSRKNIIHAFSFCVYLFLIFLMLPVSSWLWENVSTFKYVQFPWRLLAVISIYQILCIMGVNNLPENYKASRTSFLLILLCFAFLLNGKQISVNGMLDDVDNIVTRGVRSIKYQFNSLTVKHEYLPRTTPARQIKTPRGNKTVIESSNEISAKPIEGNNTYKIKYELTAETETDVIINQLYFPGWHIEVNDKTIPPNTLKKNINQDGRLRLHLPRKGKYKVIAYYNGPPYQGILFSISLSTLVLFITFLFLKRKT